MYPILSHLKGNVYSMIPPSQDTLPKEKGSVGHWFGKHCILRCSFLNEIMY